MLRDYAPGPFGLIHYRYEPEGRPVMFVHQAASSSRQFEAVYPLMTAAGFAPIGLDLPGFGGSDPTPFAPRMRDWIRIVDPVLDRLGLKQVDMVGHHTGSPFATEYALRHPRRVRRLVLHGAMLFTPQARADRLEGIAQSSGERAYALDGSHLQKAYQSRAAMFGPGAEPRMITRQIVDAYTATGPGWYGTHAVYTYDHAAAFRRLRHPTLVIANTGDRVYPETRRIQSLRPDIPYVELPGGTVDIQDQAPREWAAEIIRFLSA